MTHINSGAQDDLVESSGYQVLDESPLEVDFAQWFVLKIGKGGLADAKMLDGCANSLRVQRSRRVEA